MELRAARDMALDLMLIHGLTGWSFYLDNAKRRAGCCHYDSKLITMSRSFVEMNGRDQVNDTMLHEIAHALAGAGAGHSSTWKRQARAIGCTAMRCYSSSVVSMPEPRFVGTCPSCGKQVKRHRRKQIACGSCCKMFNYGRFTSAFLFTWRDNGPS